MLIFLFIDDIQEMIMRQAADQNAQWRASFNFVNIIGRSHAINNAIRIAKVAARSSAATLILGESGVGKELFAHAIHNTSKRADRPFVSINCGAIPRELIEAELFGYTPNAFTGASGRGATGKFSIADGGTLFLDEIADLSADAQVKLLRAISTGEIVRVGGARPEKIDVRIICATNKNIQSEVENSYFREDLYYRLNVFEIRVPPLRERLEDIEEIIKYFIDAGCRKIFNIDAREIKITPEFIAGLKNYSWPGNVRQLQAVLEREIYHLSGPPYVLSHLPDSILNAPPSPVSSGQAACDIRPLKEMERDMIKAALARFEWNVEKTVSALQISRATLYRKINEYGLNKRK